MGWQCSKSGLASVCLLLFLYRSVWRWLWRWDSEITDLPSHFLLTFYRRQGRKPVLKEEGMKGKQEKRSRINITKNIGQLFFFNLPLRSCCFQLFPSPDPVKSSFTITSRGHDADFLTLTCTHTWLQTLSLSICLMRAEGDGIARSFHVEASSFLFSQVHRRKTRLPESHAELKGCQEKKGI